MSRTTDISAEKERTGILAGGNWILDFIKMIDVYPDENALANITAQKSGNGGAPFNVLKAIWKMGFSIPLEGVGVLGDDDIGGEILLQCLQMGITTRQMKTLPGIGTSYTDVMTVCASGKRTFFHFRGANALLEEKDFDFPISQAKIFHLGYLLLLDHLDMIHPDGFSGAAKVLKKAKEAGMITSSDIVSEQSDRYHQVIPSSLPYIDYLFINELEAYKLTGIRLLDQEGEVLVSNAYQAADRILKMGVLSWVIIHFPKGALAVDKTGKQILHPGVDLPTHLVKGTVGAGDAFAAGVLVGVHEGWEMKDSLKLGVSVAASSLMDSTASEAILPWEDCLQLVNKFGYREIG